MAITNDKKDYTSAKSYAVLQLLDGFSLTNGNLVVTLTSGEFRYGGSKVATLADIPSLANYPTLTADNIFTGTNTFGAVKTNTLLPATTALNIGSSGVPLKLESSNIVIRSETNVNVDASGEFKYGDYVVATLNDIPSLEGYATLSGNNAFTGTNSFNTISVVTIGPKLVGGTVGIAGGSVTVITSDTGNFTWNTHTVATQDWVTEQGYLVASALDGYATESYVTTALNDYDTSAEVTQKITDAVKGITSFKFEIVETLPSSGDVGTIYLVEAGEEPDYYNEYIWVNTRFELLGTTRIDLSNYPTLNGTNAFTGTNTFSTVNILTSITNPSSNHLVITARRNIVLDSTGSGKVMYGSNEVATVNQLPSLEGYATETYVNGKVDALQKIRELDLSSASIDSTTTISGAFDIAETSDPNDGGGYYDGSLIKVILPAMSLGDSGTAPSQAVLCSFTSITASGVPTHESALANVAVFNSSNELDGYAKVKIRISRDHEVTLS